MAKSLNPKLLPFALNFHQEEQAYVIWYKFTVALSSEEEEAARQELMKAPWQVQQAIMRAAAMRILNPSISRRINPFS